MATILVVDDASFMRTRMKKILTEAGHEVIEAENGLQAVANYQEAQPDAVVMDITMPEMDGLASLQEIRKLDPDARVIMVTAINQQQVVLQALKDGAKDFLVKPCDSDRLLAAVSKLCA